MLFLLTFLDQLFCQFIHDTKNIVNVLISVMRGLCVSVQREGGGEREEGKREEVEVTGKSEDVGTRRQVSCRNQRHLIGTHKKVIITAIK